MTNITLSTCICQFLQGATNKRDEVPREDWIPVPCWLGSVGIVNHANRDMAAKWYGGGDVPAKYLNVGKEKKLKNKAKSDGTEIPKEKPKSKGARKTFATPAPIPDHLKPIESSGDSLVCEVDPYHRASGFSDHSGDDRSEHGGGDRSDDSLAGSRSSRSETSRVAKGGSLTTKISSKVETLVPSCSVEDTSLQLSTAASSRSAKGSLSPKLSATGVPKLVIRKTDARLGHGLVKGGVSGKRNATKTLHIVSNVPHEAISEVSDSEVYGSPSRKKKRKLYGASRKKRDSTKRRKLEETNVKKEPVDAEDEQAEYAVDEEAETANDSEDDRCYDVKVVEKINRISGAVFDSHPPRTETHRLMGELKDCNAGVVGSAKALHDSITQVSSSFTESMNLLKTFKEEIKGIETAMTLVTDKFSATEKSSKEHTSKLKAIDTAVEELVKLPPRETIDFEMQYDMDESLTTPQQRGASYSAGFEAGRTDERNRMSVQLKVEYDNGYAAGLQANGGGHNAQGTDQDIVSGVSASAPPVSVPSASPISASASSAAAPSSSEPSVSAPSASTISASASSASAPSDSGEIPSWALVIKKQMEEFAAMKAIWECNLGLISTAPHTGNATIPCPTGLGPESNSASSPAKASVDPHGSVGSSVPNTVSSPAKASIDPHGSIISSDPASSPAKDPFFVEHGSDIREYEMDVSGPNDSQTILQNILGVEFSNDQASTSAEEAIADIVDSLNEMDIPEHDEKLSPERTESEVGDLCLFVK
jgi:hypothetical protein